MCSLLYSNSISGHVPRDTLTHMHRKIALRIVTALLFAIIKLETTIHSGMCELIVDYLYDAKLYSSENGWTRSVTGKS